MELEVFVQRWEVVHVSCSERESIRAEGGDGMRSESCAEVLSKGVSRPVIGAVSVSCAELALGGDITGLENLEEGCVLIRMEVRCDGGIRR